MACITASLLLTGSSKRQLLTVPAGKGKSRIICGIATQLSKIHSGKRRILIGFSSEILHRTDSAVYDELKSILKIDIKTLVGME